MQFLPLVKSADIMKSRIKVVLTPAVGLQTASNEVFLFKHAHTFAAA